MRAGAHGAPSLCGLLLAKEAAPVECGASANAGGCLCFCGFEFLFGRPHPNRSIRVDVVNVA
jgi:hypothetical protein